jgi:uncharacterized membrane protein
MSIEKPTTTFGDLYDRIKSGEILSPKEREEFEQRIQASGLAEKRSQIIANAEAARNELSRALGDMKGKDGILSKLDSLIPEGTRDILPASPEAAMAKVMDV